MSPRNPCFPAKGRYVATPQVRACFWGPSPKTEVATSLHRSSEALFAIDSDKTDTPSDQHCSDVATFSQERPSRRKKAGQIGHDHD
jgi:hypothetical protein